MLGHNRTDTSTSLWNAALTVPDSPSKGRGKIKKSEMVVYPEFELCSQCVEDQYWKDIFQQCARKKFPKGFLYQDNYLRHRQSNNMIMLPDDIMAKTQTAMYFFQENGKMYSKRDQLIRRVQLEDNIVQQLTNASLDWKKVATSKNRRINHIKDYVERKYGSLKPHIKNELIVQITTGFETKFITKENVCFDGGQILYIDGVEANENGVYFTRELPSQKILIPTNYIEERSKVHRHYDNWSKYVDSYAKYLGASVKYLSSTPSLLSMPSGFTPEENYSHYSEYSLSSG